MTTIPINCDKSLKKYIVRGLSKTRLIEINTSEEIMTLTVLGKSGYSVSIAPYNKAALQIKDNFIHFDGEVLHIPSPLTVVEE